MSKHEDIWNDGWNEGFGDGLDAELEELYEAAHLLKPEYVEILDLLVEQVERKYNEMPDVLN